MGNFSFYQKDNVKGNLIGTLDSSIARNMNLTKQPGWTNDEIRSLQFDSIEAGTVLELWDDSTNRDSDDWVRFEFTKPSTGVINNIERPGALDGIKVTRFGHGNLAGKVSHIDLFPSGPVARAYLALDAVYPWNAKGGRAYEFLSNDSNFRVWKSDVTANGSGVTLVSKFDHIRGGVEDDHAAMTLSLDGSGIVSDLQIKVELAGKPAILEVLDARNAVLMKLIDASTDPKVKALAVIGAAIGELQTAIAAAIIKLNEKGGRLIFPDVIKARANEIGTAVINAILAGK